MCTIVHVGVGTLLYSHLHLRGMITNSATITVCKHFDVLFCICSMWNMGTHDLPAITNVMNTIMDNTVTVMKIVLICHSYKCIHNMCVQFLQMETNTDVCHLKTSMGSKTTQDVKNGTHSFNLRLLWLFQ